jgi:uncharacterized protein
MGKHQHEIRDPIHVFVHLNSDERKILDSRAFQRLRYVHQLALTYLLYPGATHRRFEHSLGVMELAGRVFDVVTDRDNVLPEVLEALPEITQKNQLDYWRSALRIAALCHDIGHLPFSHAAEKELLPNGWNHERITRELILSPEMTGLLTQMTPPLRPLEVVKLAIGPKKAKDLPFSSWESILAEIIVGDAFGVDRIDYLLRDSHHAGVAYGKFDHYRLIDTLRILPAPPADKAEHERMIEEIVAGLTVHDNEHGTEVEGESKEGLAKTAGASRKATMGEPALGVEEGGIHSAEALMLARYFMYSQLYLHPVRRIYDIHLKDFLLEWLEGGQFSTDVAKHLEVTDNEVTAAFLKAARDAGLAGHDAAARIVFHRHFHLLYQRHPDDVAVNPEAGQAIALAASEKFGKERVRWDRYAPERDAPDFPLRTKDGRIVSSRAVSDTLARLPVISIDYVFVDPTILKESQEWLRVNRAELIKPKEATDHG